MNTDHGRTRTSRHRAFLYSAVLIAMVVCSGAGEPSQSDTVLSIVPDSLVQDEITRVVAVLASERSEQEKADTLEAFKQFNGLKKEELLLQSLLAYDREVDWQEDPWVEVAKRMIISHLVKDIEPESRVAAVLAHFEKTTDPVLKKNLRMVLDTVVLERTRPDFTMLDAYLSKEEGEQSRACLIEYMYRVNPEAAMLMMARKYSGEAAVRDVEEHLAKAHAEAVDDFSSSDRWWESLYAAEMMRKNLKLRSEAAMTELANCRHPFVERTLSEIE